MVSQQLIVNIDQTPVKMVPVSEYTMSDKGADCVSVIEGDNEKMFIAVFSVTMNGKFLPEQLIYGGETERCHPKMDFPVRFHVTHNPKHRSNTDTTKEPLTKIMILYTETVKKEMKLSDSQKAIIVWDTFKGQNNNDVQNLPEKHNTAEVIVPENTTVFNQPLDVSVNRPSKHFMREKFQGWYTREVEKKINAGQNTSDISIDMGIPVMCELTS